MLDESDLNALMKRFIGWLMAVLLPAMAAGGFWVAGVQKNIDDLDDRITTISVNGSQPVANLRIDLAVTRAEMAALRDQITDMRQTLQSFRGSVR